MQGKTIPKGRKNQFVRRESKSRQDLMRTKSFAKELDKLHLCPSDR